MEFLDFTSKIVEKFFDLKGNKVVRIIANADTDGITGASILCRAFYRGGIKFVVSVVKQLDEEIIESLKREDYGIVFLIDLGSNCISKLEKVDKKIFILDHHYPEKFEKGLETNIFLLNPHLFGIDGTTEISAAGVVYFFVNSMEKRNEDLAYLAIVGAIGDIQERNGFSGLNNEVLGDAVKSRKIEIRNGLKFYGIYSRALHKFLEYSTNPYIHGVTGNEDGAIKFLEGIGIDVKIKNRYKNIGDLNEDEIKRLINALMSNKIVKDNEEIFGRIYLLHGEELEIMDCREFSTLLNSCGKMGKGSVGIGVCMSDLKSREKAFNLLGEYRMQITRALNWFYSNKKSNKVIERNGYVIINGGSIVGDTIIGTVASILSKSNVYSEGTIIMSMCHNIEDDVKVSLRLCGRDGADLREIIKRICEECNGSYGGHRLAAGAIIPSEKEEEFLKTSIKVLDEIFLKNEIEKDLKVV